MSSDLTCHRQDQEAEPTGRGVCAIFGMPSHTRKNMKKQKKDRIVKDEPKDRKRPRSPIVALPDLAAVERSTSPSHSPASPICEAVERSSPSYSPPSPLYSPAWPDYSPPSPRNKGRGQLWWDTTDAVASEKLMNFEGSNPFFDELYPEITERRAADAARRPIDALRVGIDYNMYEKRLAGKYALSAPLDEELRAIAAVGLPIVEVGAGRGYWARCLYDRGCDVVATDASLAKEPYFPIVRADAAEAARRNAASRALLLVWPSFDSTWSRDAAVAYTRAGGTCVIYEGEAPGGCTACDEFFAHLAAEFQHAYCLSTRKRSSDGLGWHDEYLDFRVRKDVGDTRQQIRGKLTELLGPEDRARVDMLQRATAAMPDSQMIQKWHTVC